MATKEYFNQVLKKLVQTTGASTSLTTDAQRNAFLSRLRSDLSNLHWAWNDMVYPIIRLLPSHPRYPFDARSDGLAGTTIVAYPEEHGGGPDAGECYWFSTDEFGLGTGRPKTVKEVLDCIISQLDQQTVQIFERDVDLSDIYAKLACLDNNDQRIIKDAFGCNYNLNCDPEEQLRWPLAQHIAEIFKQLPLEGHDETTLGQLQGPCSEEPYPTLEWSVPCEKITWSNDFCCINLHYIASVCSPELSCPERTFLDDFYEVAQYVGYINSDGDFKCEESLVYDDVVRPDGDVVNLCAPFDSLVPSATHPMGWSLREALAVVMDEVCKKCDTGYGAVALGNQGGSINGILDHTADECNDLFKLTAGPNIDLDGQENNKVKISVTGIPTSILGDLNDAYHFTGNPPYWLGMIALENSYEGAESPGNNFTPHCVPQPGAGIYLIDDTVPLESKLFAIVDDCKANISATQAIHPVADRAWFSVGAHWGSAAVRDLVDEGKIEATEVPFLINKLPDYKIVHTEDSYLYMKTQKHLPTTFSSERNGVPSNDRRVNLGLDCPDEGAIWIHMRDEGSVFDACGEALMKNHLYYRMPGDGEIWPLSKCGGEGGGNLQDAYDFDKNQNNNADGGRVLLRAWEGSQAPGADHRSFWLMQHPDFVRAFHPANYWNTPSLLNTSGGPSGRRCPYYIPWLAITDHYAPSDPDNLATGHGLNLSTGNAGPVNLGIQGVDRGDRFFSVQLRDQCFTSPPDRPKIEEDCCCDFEDPKSEFFYPWGGYQRVKRPDSHPLPPGYEARIAQMMEGCSFGEGPTDCTPEQLKALDTAMRSLENAMNSALSDYYASHSKWHLFELELCLALEENGTDTELIEDIEDKIQLQATATSEAISNALSSGGAFAAVVVEYFEKCCPSQSILDKQIDQYDQEIRNWQGIQEAAESNLKKAQEELQNATQPYDICVHEESVRQHKLDYESAGAFVSLFLELNEKLETIDCDSSDSAETPSLSKSFSSTGSSGSANNSAAAGQVIGWANPKYVTDSGQKTHIIEVGDCFYLDAGVWSTRSDPKFKNSVKTDVSSNLVICMEVLEKLCYTIDYSQGITDPATGETWYPIVGSAIVIGKNVMPDMDCFEDCPCDFEDPSHNWLYPFLKNDTSGDSSAWGAGIFDKAPYPAPTYSLSGFDPGKYVTPAIADVDVYDPWRSCYESTAGNQPLFFFSEQEVLDVYAEQGKLKTITYSEGQSFYVSMSANYQELSLCFKANRAIEYCLPYSEDGTSVQGNYYFTKQLNEWIAEYDSQDDNASKINGQILRTWIVNNNRNYGTDTFPGADMDRWYLVFGVSPATSAAIGNDAISLLPFPCMGFDILQREKEKRPDYDKTEIETEVLACDCSFGDTEVTPLWKWNQGYKYAPLLNFKGVEGVDNTESSKTDNEYLKAWSFLNNTGAGYSGTLDALSHLYGLNPNEVDIVAAVPYEAWIKGLDFADKVDGTNNVINYKEGQLLALNEVCLRAKHNVQYHCRAKEAVSKYDEIEGGKGAKKFSGSTPVWAFSLKDIDPTFNDDTLYCWVLGPKDGHFAIGEKYSESDKLGKFAGESTYWELCNWRDRHVAASYRREIKFEDATDDTFGNTEFTDVKRYVHYKGDRRTLNKLIPFAEALGSIVESQETQALDDAAYAARAYAIIEESGEAFNAEIDKQVSLRAGLEADTYTTFSAENPWVKVESNLDPSVSQALFRGTKVATPNYNDVGNLSGVGIATPVASRPDCDINLRPLANYPSQGSFEVIADSFNPNVYTFNMLIAGLDPNAEALVQQSGNPIIVPGENSVFEIHPAVPPVWGIETNTNTAACLIFIRAKLNSNGIPQQMPFQQNFNNNLGVVNPQALSGQNQPYFMGLTDAALGQSWDQNSDSDFLRLMTSIADDYNNNGTRYACGVFLAEYNFPDPDGDGVPEEEADSYTELAAQGVCCIDSAGDGPGDDDDPPDTSCIPWPSVHFWQSPTYYSCMPPMFVPDTCDGEGVVWVGALDRSKIKELFKEGVITKEEAARLEQRGCSIYFREPANGRVFDLTEVGGGGGGHSSVHNFTLGAGFNGGYNSTPYPQSTQVINQYDTSVNNYQGVSLYALRGIGFYDENFVDPGSNLNPLPQNQNALGIGIFYEGITNANSPFIVPIPGMIKTRGATYSKQYAPSGDTSGWVYTSYATPLFAGFPPDQWDPEVSIRELHMNTVGGTASIQLLKREVDDDGEAHLIVRNLIGGDGVSLDYDAEGALKISVTDLPDSGIGEHGIEEHTDVPATAGHESGKVLTYTGLLDGSPTFDWTYKPHAESRGVGIDVLLASGGGVGGEANNHLFRTLAIPSGTDPQLCIEPQYHTDGNQIEFRFTGQLGNNDSLSSFTDVDVSDGVGSLQVLAWNSDLGKWYPTNIGSAQNGGEANEGQNVGGGVEVFKDKTNVRLNFRSLTGENGITISQHEDTICISGTGGIDDFVQEINFDPNTHDITLYVVGDDNENPQSISVNIKDNFLRLDDQTEGGPTTASYYDAESKEVVLVQYNDSEHRISLAAIVDLFDGLNLEELIEAITANTQTNEDQDVILKSLRECCDEFTKFRIDQKETNDQFASDIAANQKCCDENSEAIAHNTKNISANEDHIDEHTEQIAELKDCCDANSKANTVQDEVLEDLVETIGQLSSRDIVEFTCDEGVLKGVNPDGEALASVNLAECLGTVGGNQYYIDCDGGSLNLYENGEIVTTINLYECLRASFEATDKKAKEAKEAADAADREAAAAKEAADTAAKEAKEADQKAASAGTNALQAIDAAAAADALAQAAVKDAAQARVDATAAVASATQAGENLAVAIKDIAQAQVDATAAGEQAAKNKDEIATLEAETAAMVKEVEQAKQDAATALASAQSAQGSIDALTKTLNNVAAAYAALRQDHDDLIQTLTDKGILKPRDG